MKQTIIDVPNTVSFTMFAFSYIYFLQQWLLAWVWVKIWPVAGSAVLGHSTYWFVWEMGLGLIWVDNYILWHVCSDLTWQTINLAWRWTGWHTQGASLRSLRDGDSWGPPHLDNWTRILATGIFIAICSPTLECRHEVGASLSSWCSCSGKAYTDAHKGHGNRLISACSGYWVPY